MLEDTEEAFLLTLLANYGADTPDQARCIEIGEDLLDVLQGAQDKIGEGTGEGDGVREVVYWEDVLARLDGVYVEVGKCSVGV